METIEIAVTLPKSVLSAARLREKELGGYLREVLAIQLYRLGQISFGKAVEIAGLSTKWELMQLLAKHDVYIDYTSEDAEQDIKTLDKLFAA